MSRLAYLFSLGPPPFVLAACTILGAWGSGASAQRGPDETAPDRSHLSLAEAGADSL